MLAQVPHDGGQAPADVIDADLQRSFVMTVSGAQVDFGDERTNGEALDLGAEQLATEENDPSRVTGGVLAWGGVAGSVLSLTAGTSRWRRDRSSTGDVLESEPVHEPNRTLPTRGVGLMPILAYPSTSDSIGRRSLSR